ncbi:MAG: imidazole glycerol phosphate synthase subunit HisH [Phycisphaerae bacterium]
MIAILDCEGAEAGGVKRALDGLQVDAIPADAADAIERASKIILPHSRSLSLTVAAMRDRQLVMPLLRAIDRGRPVLGISAGFHLLLDVSYEEGQHTGLGVVHGAAKRLDFGTHPAAKHFSIPHQGWNQVRWSVECPLTAGLRSGEYFYFDHSYFGEPLDERLVAASCTHGVEFSAIIWKDHIFGTQFLPERSDDAGRALLTNFAAM